MNSKGSVFFIIIIAFVVLLLLPTFFMSLFPIAKPIFQVIIAFMIMGYLKQMGLEGITFWVIYALLLYFLVWKYINVASSFYVLMFLMGAGFLSTVIWGSSFFHGIFKSKKQ